VTQHEILLERAIWSRRLNLDGEPIEPAVRHTMESFGPAAVSVAATAEAAWLFLRQSTGTSFTALPITGPLQPITTDRAFAELQAVDGRAVGAWALPFMDLSRVAIANAGGKLSESGELPLALTDVSSPMRPGATPGETTMMLIGTANTRRLGSIAPRGQFAFLRVTEEEGGGGAGGETGGSSHGGEGTDAGEAGQANGGSGGRGSSGGSAGRPSHQGGTPSASGGSGAASGDDDDSHGCSCRVGSTKPTSVEAAWLGLTLALTAFGRRKGRRVPSAR
jgi:MYXO-CTERM domain-containing protein